MPAPATITYTVEVTATFDDDLTPRYTALIYRMIVAGVCGPFVEADHPFTSLDAIDTWLTEWGFERTARYHRGSAPLARLWASE